MRFSKQDPECHTAEEYRASAKVHQQAYKNQWKSFLRSGVFTLAALVALLVISMAWFLNNSRVSVDGINISAEGADFELGSEGVKGIYDDDILAKFFQSAIELADGITSSAHTSINWLVSEDSNMGKGNYSSTDVDFSTQERKDYAIEPGSSGNLTFYIIPAKDGTQTFHLNLSVLPYKATVNDQNEITSVATVGENSSDSAEDQYARQFISGHILFFLTSVEVPDRVSEDTEGTPEAVELMTETSAAESVTATYGWIKDGTFDITINQAVAGTKYHCTISWQWPQVFSEVILKTGDEYLNERTPILNSAMREEILADMVENPQKYFYNSLTKKPLDTANSLISGVKGIADIHSKSPVCGGTDGYSAQNFVDLSSFYNQADQMIGSQISFILVELTAEKL